MTQGDQAPDFIQFRPDCGNCFALCCLALCFNASQGFPADKAAGEPCPNLAADFRCRIHSELWPKGCRGCVSYDCLGAGQLVSQNTYRGRDWQQNPVLREEMGRVYLVMQQLQEMRWYLTQAQAMRASGSLHPELAALESSIRQLTFLAPEELLRLDLPPRRAEIARLLRQTSDLVRGPARAGSPPRYKTKKKLGPGADLMGLDLRQADLRGRNLHGACLIAADLRGAALADTDLLCADLRDTDLRGADLRRSLFLTQPQLNAARGDQATLLPQELQYPESWRLRADN